jgi:hypothetical protein
MARILSIHSSDRNRRNPFKHFQIFDCSLSSRNEKLAQDVNVAGQLKPLAQTHFLSAS